MKIRLYAQPPGRPSLELEVALPDDGPDAAETPDAGVRLKCFSPPPNSQAEHARYGPTKAWLVTLNAEDVEHLRSLSGQIDIVPFGDAKPRGGGWPVELSFTLGQAEARLSWWMEAPSAWQPVKQLVTDLMDMSAREASGTLDARSERATDEELGISSGPAPAPKKKGLFGRLMG